MLQAIGRSGNALRATGLALLAFATLVVLALPAAQAEAPADPESQEPRKYIVVLEDSVEHPANVADRHAENRGTDVDHVYSTALKGYAAVATPAEAALIRRDPNVETVVRDAPFELFSQEMPTGVRRVYAYQNTKADIDEIDDARVNADVAILDSGVSHTHPDLNVVSRVDCQVQNDTDYRNCISNAGADDSGHGTHVAGTVGAIDNGFGVVGTAPGARLWSVKVWSSGASDLSDVIAGVNWVTAHADQIEVANVSGGCAPDFPFCEEAEEAALRPAVEASVRAGVVYVAAAANEERDVALYPATVPAAYPEVLTVSAIADFDGLPGGKTPPTNAQGTACVLSSGTVEYDFDDTSAEYTNWGGAVDVAAPGSCIRSTAMDGGYEVMSGTSMATPHVAGHAAILASVNNPNDLAGVERITKEIVDGGSQAWVEDAGPDNKSGDGIREPLLDMTYPRIAPTAVTGIGVTSHIEGAMDLYARKTTGGIGQMEYNPFTTPAGWGGWGSLSLPNGTQPIEGSPAVISRNKDGRDIFVTGTNRQLYYRNYQTGQGWGPWYWIQGPIGFVGSPAATVRPDNGFDVVVRGADNVIYQRTYAQSTGWSAWKGVGAPPGGATSAPAIATRFNQAYVDVMVRGGNGSIWHRAYGNGAWSSWVDLGGASASSPALTATRNTYNLYLFVRRADNQIWYRRLPPYSAWSAWSSLGGGFVGDPAATSRSLETVDVFGVGADNRIRDRRFLQGGWTSWMLIEDNCRTTAC
jgi:subtilisin family serine protease